MIIDDEIPATPKKSQSRSLDNLSVPELKEYLGRLKTEITRVEGDIAKKEAYHTAAAGLFGKPY